MYQFITIPKEYASDYRNRLISKQEREMLVWLRMLASPYGIAVADLDSLANDCFSKGAGKNYANKILLSLKRKRYIYYEERSGRRGSFEIHLDHWPLPRKVKTDPLVVKRLDKLFGDGGVVRGDGDTDTLDTSEVHTEVDEQKQRSDDIKDAIDALGNTFSIKPSFRGSYTDTEKEKENETTRSEPFKKGRNAENPRKRGNLSVETFFPTSDEEERLLEIARNLGEPDMRFLLGSKEKHGMVMIERALKECNYSAGFEHAENKGAFFNSVLQKLVNANNV